MVTELYTIAIFILLLAGCIASLLIRKTEHTGKIITILNLVALLVALTLFYQLNMQTIQPVYWFNFYVDELGTMVTILILILSTVAAYFSIPVINGDEKSIKRYYFWFSLFIFAMVGIGISADILSTYLFLEGATIFSAFLVAHDRTHEAFEASLKYLIICSFGTALIIFGLSYIITINIVSFSYQDIYLFLQTNTTTDITTIKIIFLALFFGFGVKAGIVPFYMWLPDAHAEAPAPISALFSGIMIETAAIALLRIVDAFSPVMVMVPELNLVIIIISVITMILGALMALVQTNIKRLLAYSSIDEIGYIMLGIGIATQMGVYGAVFDIINHSFLKGMLFLISGALLYATGTKDMRKMGGLAKMYPLLATSFLIAGLSMGGVPPLNGFYSKFLIYEATFEAGYLWATILAMIVSLIALGYFIKATHMIFFGEPKIETTTDGGAAKKLPIEINVSIVILLILIIIASIFPEFFLKLVIDAISGLNSF